jgi:ribosome-associated protein
LETNKIYETAIHALSDKKAQDIQLIKVRDLTIIADYFIIAAGTSSTQVKALADEVEVKLSALGVEPHHIEGKATGWILLDYDTVVVHVFHAQSREFYQLEKLWHDGEKIDIEKF